MDPDASSAGTSSRPTALAAAVCTVTQYGQSFAADTVAATVSFSARLTEPAASSVSRSIAQHAAASSGAGECMATGAAIMPKSRSACA